MLSAGNSVTAPLSSRLSRFFGHEFGPRFTVH
jgi:hypothetical protein